jgi:hypothetical protein
MRKQSKIIGIFICMLLVSIGIEYSLFSSPKKAENTAKATEDTTVYTVEWASINDTPLQLSEFVTKGSEYLKTISYETSSLKEVRFHLSWTDDKATFFNRHGLDTLTLQITAPDGHVYKQSATSARKTKLGFIEISVPVRSLVPTSFSVPSAERSTIESKLRSQYSDTTTVSQNFTVTVSVKVGELRPLKRLADKGNMFAMEVTPSYYAASISQCSGNNGAVLATLWPVFPDCPICHGHYMHYPWCPYYEDPFDHDPFDDPFDNDPFS